MLCYYANLQRLYSIEIKSSHLFIHFALKMVTPKRRLLTLIFACLCFKESLIITLVMIIMIIVILIIMMIIIMMMMMMMIITRHRCKIQVCMKKYSVDNNY